MSGGMSSGQTRIDQDNSDEKPRRSLLVALAIALVACIIVYLVVNNLELAVLPQYASIWEGIKVFIIALVPAIIVAIIDHYQTIGQTSNLVARIIGRDLKAYVGQEIEGLIQGRDTFGLVRFHDAMEFKALFQSLQPGDQLLWHDTYAPADQFFANQLEDAVRRGVQILMLAIDARDPMSDNARNASYRAEEFSDPNIRIRFMKEAADFPTNIARLLSTAPERGTLAGSIEIRLYHDLPCLPMYIIRHNQRLVRGFSSFFLTKPTGLNFVHIEWAPTSRGTGVLEELAAYFDQKWQAQTKPDGGGTVFKCSAAGIETNTLVSR